MSPVEVILWSAIGASLAVAICAPIGYALGLWLEQRIHTWSTKRGIK